jgi:uncharacterized membrane protein (DUF106 family)
MDILAEIFSSLNQVFDPIIAIDPNPKNPLLTIFLIALIISFFTQLAQKYLMDHERMDEIKLEVAEFQNKMTAVRKSGDADAMNKLQAEQADFMKVQSEMMMMSFKPMLVTMVPIMVIYWWMRSSPLANMHVFLPLFNNFNIGFFWWYFLCSFALSQVVRKLVGLKSSF